MKVYVTYTEHNQCIHDNYGYDGPYTGYSEYDLNQEVEGVYIENLNTCLKNEVEIEDSNKGLKEGSPVHLVVVYYSDGGTFGRTNGKLSVAGAYSDFKKASKLAKDV